MRRAQVIELVGVLLFHGFGGFTWFTFMLFAADAGSERDLYEACGIGAATWLATTFVIVWLWRSGRPHFWLIPFAWWLPSWLLAFTIAYGWGVWNEPVSFGYFAKPS